MKRHAVGWQHNLRGRDRCDDGAVDESGRGDGRGSCGLSQRQLELPESVRIPRQREELAADRRLGDVGGVVSKVAFAYLAMELVDDGQLDLDKPIYQYLPKPLPEYPKYSDLADDPRYKRITARMLLSHTSRICKLALDGGRPQAKDPFRAGIAVCLLGRGHRLTAIGG